MFYVSFITETPRAPFSLPFPSTVTLWSHLSSCAASRIFAHCLDWTISTWKGSCSWCFRHPLSLQRSLWAVSMKNLFGAVVMEWPTPCSSPCCIALSSKTWRNTELGTRSSGLVLSMVQATFREILTLKSSSFLGPGCYFHQHHYRCQCSSIQQFLWKIALRRSFFAGSYIGGMCIGVDMHYVLTVWGVWTRP